MDCERFERVVLDLLYDELDELTAAAARRHIEHCVRCQSVAAGLKATREVGALPLVAAPVGLEQRILDAERGARAHLPFRQRLGRAVSVLAGYAMRPQLAMAALLLLAIGSSLIFFRALPGNRDRVRVTERGAPEGESDTVAILPVPVAAEPAPATTASVTAQAQKDEGRSVDKAEPGNPQDGEPNESEGDSAYDAALAAFRDGRYGEARRQFEEVATRGGSQAAEAALYAAQSAKMAEGCPVAVALFDLVSTRHPGTRAGYDATWQAASCYETLGNTERARRSYQALLDDPNYGERARTSLAQLDRAEQTTEVAARKARPTSPAQDPKAVEAGSPPPASGALENADRDAKGDAKNAAETR